MRPCRLALSPPFTAALLPSVLLAAALLTGVVFPAPARAAEIAEEAYSALRWRSVGPFRAGWSTCAEGVPDEPDTFYFGAADGGVWKSTDAGRTWEPLFEHEAAASIGALALAPSAPRVLYVGTGQVAPRWDIANGNGVYRSADGGRSWQHRGLADTQHIGRILIDPRDPDTVLVAALGHFFAPNPQRGVFRTEDGGETWERVLFLDADTGAVDLAADPEAPETVFAALWQARRYPWQAYFTPIAGPGSGIYRSADGGRSWTRLTGAGLPAGPLGRIGLAVAPGTGGRRVYAVIQAEAGAGLYRSEDGGETWWQANADPGLAAWYFGRLTVEPGDPDTVYVLGRSLLRSTDGGITFDIVRGSPGGDDFHFLWINPRAPERRVLASDQGTIVSVNGGKTWSSWYNQPTGQFYHVATDDRFPYRIYSGQQDSGTVAVASRGDYGQLTFRDWHPVGGDERDYDIPFPGDPDIVYGSGLGGRLSRWDARTGQVQNTSPWPVSSYGQRPTRVRYRSTWIAPLAIGREAPYPIYMAAQVVFRSTDGGQSWETISPDLTGTVPGTADCEGDVPVARARACGYSVISTLAPSPLSPDVIWVGTDAGQIHLSRDGGASWQEVTPQGLPAWGRLATLDASPTDPATARAAVDRHRMDDLTPYIYQTHDFGRTWQQVGGTLPAGAHVNVVRQDPERPGLLYAGTSRGVWVSFDDGGRWQSLRLNLPTTGVNDLTIHGRDLIAATEGRALWVLDDLTPLRHLHPEALAAGAVLLPPAPAIRLSSNENRDTPLPREEPTAPNPPTGAVIDFILPAVPAGPVRLEIVDAAGTLVGRFGSDLTPERPEAERYFTADWLAPLAPLSARAGHNRFVWDLHLPRPRAPGYEYSIAATPWAGTTAVPRGPRVAPGSYTVHLSVGGRTLSQPLIVEMDPRVGVGAEEIGAQLAFYHEVARALEEATDGLAAVQAVAAHLEEAAGELPGQRRGGEKLLADVRLRQEEVRGFASGGSEDNLATIAGVLTSLITDIEAVDRPPTEAQRQVLALYRQGLDRALEHWRSLAAGALGDLDRRLAHPGG